MVEMRPEANNPVKGVRTTFQIVEALKDLNGGGVTEVANHTGISKSSVHNYLSTLYQEGYVVKSETEYNVGLRFLNIGAVARQNRNVYEVAKDEIEKLANETNELVNLLVEENGMGVYIYRETGDDAVNVDSYVGHRVHLHNTALGKAILAYRPREHINQILDVHGMPQTTNNTIVERDQLFDELENIRDEDISFDREERLKGLRCVAAPITNEVGDAVAAISVSGPSRRMQGDRFEEIIPNLLLDSQNVIELNLTYS